MTEPRVNDSKAKRLRARLRAERRPCHICGGEIDYTAHHHDPRTFQLDHLWQVANGGPIDDYDNVDASHRACNRARSDTIDATTIATATAYGVTITSATAHAPDRQPCPECAGATHNPAPGVTFVTSRNWWTTPA